MPPKKISTSEAPAMTQAAIKKLVADSVSAALEAQAANMANTDNTTGPREAPIVRKCSYKEFMRYQPINFKGTEGAIGLIHWFERTELVFSHSNCSKDCKVKFATGTLIEEALSWKYYPRTKIQKMEDEFYHLTRKGNDIKTYVRRFQELATLCPTMVPDFKKMIEVFIRTEGKKLSELTLPPQLKIVGHLTKNCRNKGPTTRSNLLLVMHVERKGIMQISAERSPTAMPRGEPTC
ncbi:hypothetical protein Tco_0866043 [Tanacetum coccineum]